MDLNSNISREVEERRDAQISISDNFQPVRKAVVIWKCVGAYITIQKVDHPITTGASLNSMLVKKLNIEETIYNVFNMEEKAWDGMHNMSFYRRLAFVITLISVLSSVALEELTTKVLKRNDLLRRQRRYLTFPPGSNFIITLSAVKALLRVQPTGWNILEEMDVPFALPSDTMLFKQFRRRDRERREIHTQIGQTLDKFGFNGTACIRRMVCESQQLIPFRGTSLVNDILLAVFRHTGEAFNSEAECDGDNFVDCSVSILSYLMGSLNLDST